jgi:Na+/H+ antiporter NhaC
MPIVVPLGHTLGAGDEGLLLGAISGVLAGSVFGDHCSPISDTTVLSSMASACDHMDHVRTQLPYALTVALTAVLVGYLATAYGLHPVISYVFGIGVLYLILRFLGRTSGEDPVTDAGAGGPQTEGARGT